MSDRVMGEVKDNKMVQYFLRQIVRNPEDLERLEAATRASQAASRQEATRRAYLEALSRRQLDCKVSNSPLFINLNLSAIVSFPS